MFAGGFDVRAARQVCADDQLPDDKIDRLLRGLDDASILSRAAIGGERYRMLDTIREYGAFWLRQLGEDHHQRRRHRDFYLDLARRGDAAWFGPDQIGWYDRTVAEHDNLRAALEHCLDHPGGHAALELGGALWFFWYACGFAKEGRHYLERALSADARPGRARTKALWAYGYILQSLGDAEGATALGDQCLAAAEQQGDDEALGPARGVCLGAMAMRGDLTALAAMSDRVLAATRAEDALTLEVFLALLGRGHERIFTGEPEQALPYLERLRDLCDRQGERWVRSYVDFFRAQMALALGEPHAARRHAHASLRVKHRMHDRMGAGLAMDVLAAATGAAGQAEPAARLLGLAQRVWETLGVPQMGTPQWVETRRACERRTRDALGDEGYDAAFRAGYDADIDAGIADVLDHPPPPGPRPRA